MSKFSVSAIGLAAMLAVTGAAQADTTVRMVSLEPADRAEKTFTADIVKEFEALHPDIKVDITYLDNEAFKAKLPTILMQTKERPDIFYSWGGGLLREQAKAGVLRDISDKVKGEWGNTFVQAGIESFSDNGKVYGVPRYTSGVVMWYNKELAQKAGIDPQQIKTWDDFLVQVKKAKDAGILPIVVGGKDKWPMHFYYGYLALRIAGKEGFERAAAGKDGGYNSPAFVRVGQEFKRLVDLKPFQQGFEDTTYDKASGMFADGKAVFHLLGNWDYGNQIKTAANGKGLGDKLGMIMFPAVKDGKGNPSDTFGGMDGWAVTKNASDASIEWLKFLLNLDHQKAGAKAGYWIPVVKGAESELTNPFFKDLAKAIAAASHHQLFLDQALGAMVGGAVNDVSVDLASGVITPEEAAKTIDEARMMQ